MKFRNVIRILYIIIHQKQHLIIFTLQNKMIKFSYIKMTHVKEILIMF